jgi:hypothetical protein
MSYIVNQCNLVIQKLFFWQTKIWMKEQISYSTRYLHDELEALHNSQNMSRFWCQIFKTVTTIYIQYYIYFREHCEH